MITVSGYLFNISSIANDYPANSFEMHLLNKMIASSEEYQYNNLNQLKFELDLRKEIVNTSIDLNNSDLAFSNFNESKCNPEYWFRTNNGGFKLKEGVNPNEAIIDIFVNGSKYATECATALMIVYYKALLNTYSNELFNKLFPKIYLMDWDVTEPLLIDVTFLHKTKDILPGDRGYFENPDFDPATPEWQGENVIILPDSMYYGHGIGITTSEEIIQALNSTRIAGATQTAYLLDSIGRPNFKKLTAANNNPAKSLVWQPFPPPISRI